MTGGVGELWGFIVVTRLINMDSAYVPTLLCDRCMTPDEIDIQYPVTGPYRLDTNSASDSERIGFQMPWDFSGSNSSTIDVASKCVVDLDHHSLNTALVMFKAECIHKTSVQPFTPAKQPLSLCPGEVRAVCA